MQPFYFGTSQQPLFGVYHAPAGPPRGIGVVLCYPLGHEYLRAHRAFRNLATALSAAGCHVLRFDYFGSGDSGGEGEETTIGRCLADVNAAIDELKDTAGVAKVSLVGLRVGAMLAALTAEKRNDIERVILWDPVVDGGEYLASVASLQRRWLVDRMGERAKIPSEDVELIGFPLTAAAREQFKETSLLPARPLQARSVSIYVSSAAAEYDRLRQEFERMPAGCAFEMVPGSGDWEDGDLVHQILLPHTMVRVIAAAVSQ